MKSPGTPLDAVGSFWPANRPDRRLAGRLTFDPHDGGRLEVVGSFHDQREVIADARAQADGSVRVGLPALLGLDAPAIQIFGDTAEGAVTLNECLGALGSYHVPWVLAGAHVPESDREFQTADFGMPQFAAWSGTTGLDASLTFRSDSQEVEEVQITYRPVPKATVDLPHGQLVLHLPYKVRGDHRVESSIEQACALGIRFAKPSSIVDIFHAHHAVEALMSIAIAAPMRVSETRVTTAGGHSLQVHARGVGAGSHVSHPARVRTEDMLFTYAQLGELSGIGRWLTVAKKFWPAIAALMARWDAPDLYLELQFFSMITAAEAFERVRLDKQDVNLKRALRKLAEVAGPPFQAMIGDIDGWATRVVRTRNEHVVHRGRSGDPHGELLYWHTCALYVLVVLCLLRECGVPEEHLPTPETRPWMATVARRLAAIATA